MIQAISNKLKALTKNLRKQFNKINFKIKLEINN